WKSVIFSGREKFNSEFHTLLLRAIHIIKNKKATANRLDEGEGEGVDRRTTAARPTRSETTMSSDAGSVSSGGAGGGGGGGYGSIPTSPSPMAGAPLGGLGAGGTSLGGGGGGGTSRIPLTTSASGELGSGLAGLQGGALTGGGGGGGGLAGMTLGLAPLDGGAAIGRGAGGGGGGVVGGSLGVGGGGGGVVGGGGGGGAVGGPSGAGGIINMNAVMNAPGVGGAMSAPPGGGAGAGGAAVGPAAPVPSGLGPGPTTIDELHLFVVQLVDPQHREGVLLELSKKRESFPDLAPILWHTVGTVAALLQEIASIYPLLTPPTLTAHASNRVCNALALLQCVASHPDTRGLFLAAHVPLYLYPFLNTQSKSRPFEYLRLTSLGVIGALVKMDDADVINFLLQTEIIPLCLRIMEAGSELSKTVATFIVQKILLDDVGLGYVCATAERFYAVSTVLNNMVANLVHGPSVRLLKHIVRCYLRLSDNARARDALRQALPATLRDNTFERALQNDITVKKWLGQLLAAVGPPPPGGGTEGQGARPGGQGQGIPGAGAPVGGMQSGVGGARLVVGGGGGGLMVGGGMTGGVDEGSMSTIQASNRQGEMHALGNATQ
ncbi:hypothetical protein ACHAWF_003030, partial [Thalassiosira exigua]